MSGSNKRREETSHPGKGKALSGPLDSLRGQTLSIEIDPCKTIHLGIEKARAYIEVRTSKMMQSSFYEGFNMRDDSSFNGDICRVLSSRYLSLNDHDRLKSP